MFILPLSVISLKCISLKSLVNALDYTDSKEKQLGVILIEPSFKTFLSKPVLYSVNTKLSSSILLPSEILNLKVDILLKSIP